MNFVIEQSFKSNKPNTFSTFIADSEAEAKQRALDYMNSSVDVSAVYVYTLSASARKVEVTQWY
jgi:hypothetical protein